LKSKIKKPEDCQTLFEIEVSKEDVAKAFDQVYDEIGRSANIPGFRVGKAPQELVRKHYANDAREEVLKRLIPDSYRNALLQHKINPIGLPEISDVSFEADKELAFKAKVDTRPDFKLKDYKAIKLERKKAVVRDEDVAKTLEDLRGMNAKYTAVEDRPVQMGDYVVSDLECFVDGKPAHKKRENLWIFVDKDSLAPGLSEKMVGIQKGEERDIEVVLPAPPDQTNSNTRRGPAMNSVESGIGGNKNLAGKPARYHVKAKEIRERKLPDLDDEFAKDLGKKDLGELKSAVSSELEARAKASAELDLENQLLNKIINDNNFPVPSGLVARQLEFMVEDAKRHLIEKGFKKDELDKKDDEFRAKFKEDAVRRVRLLFILDEIARLENIEAADEDLKEAYRAIAARSGKTDEEVRSYYEKEDLAESLRDRLREEKVIEFLLKSAEILDR